MPAVVLAVTRVCVTHTSLVLLAVNVIVSLITAIRAPLTRNDANNSFFWRLVPYRDMLQQPPYLFKEVRLTLLSISLLYCVGRLIYEAFIGDVFVVLMVTRLCMTLYMLGDQWWLCRNWKQFFVEHNMRSWLWLRLFISCAANSWAASLNVMNDFEWVYCASRILAGLAVIFWYFWGKRWEWEQDDLDEDRRLPAVTYAATTSSAIFFARMIYDLVVHNGFWKQSLTALVGYGVLGMVMYVVDRRQRSLVATINNRRSSMETLERSVKHASNKSTPRATPSPRAGQSPLSPHSPRTPRVDQILCGTTVNDEKDNDNDAAGRDRSVQLEEHHFQGLRGVVDVDVDAGIIESGGTTSGANDGYVGDASCDVAMDRSGGAVGSTQNGGVLGSTRSGRSLGSSRSDRPDPGLALFAAHEDDLEEEDPVGTTSRSDSVLANLRKASVFELFSVVRKMSIQRHSTKHKVDTIVADRVVAVVYQVAVYYTVLFLVEPILERAYYSPALGTSMIQWCPTLTSPDVVGWLQMIYDAIG